MRAVKSTNRCIESSLLVGIARLAARFHTEPPALSLYDMRLTRLRRPTATTVSLCPDRG